MIKIKFNSGRLGKIWNQSEVEGDLRYYLYMDDNAPVTHKDGYCSLIESDLMSFEEKEYVCKLVLYNFIGRAKANKSFSVLRFTRKTFYNGWSFNQWKKEIIKSLNDLKPLVPSFGKRLNFI